jgi:hypothetical protein
MAWAETAPRPTYRSTLTQPSQMGNFKHHSLRTGDRERDSTDKDRERDIRDKEGQERLRNVKSPSQPSSSWEADESPALGQVRP